MTGKDQLRIADYLSHILDAIQRIEHYLGSVAHQTAFMSDTLVQDAVIRNLEVIGEAANNVRSADPDFAARHPAIPWDLIYGMRNRISHGYFDINLEVVWQTVRQDLPALKAQVAALLEKMPGFPPARE